METSTDQILSLVRTQGVIRPRDLVARNIATVALTRMIKNGSLVRVARGLYALPNRQASEYASFGEVAVKYPQGIICLLSALRFHELGTQSPYEVWLAIPNKSRPPALEYPPLRIVRFSGAALTEGVETHLIDGVPVRITSVERTVADCFKFRNKIGMDVALEALREAWRDKKMTMNELWRFAKVNRVTNIIRPYLESTT
ncbi:MAG: transcriptional regulator [Treponema sp.]|nr:MAG: transcriptional regulator [Treponema sp.]